MLAAVDGKRVLCATRPPESADQSSDDEHVHDRADDHEDREQPDEVRAVGPLTAQRILKAFAAAQRQESGRADHDQPHHWRSESAGARGLRSIWVWGGVLLIVSVRAPTASLRS